MLDSPVVRLINNWLHDVGTGLWAACALVIVVLEAEIAELAGMPQAAAAVLESQHAVLMLAPLALADIAATGGLRLAYWRSQTPAEELASKRPALIGKHVAFAVVYGGGTWAMWSLVH